MLQRFVCTSNKDHVVVVAVTEVGRLFQMAGTAELKARLPYAVRVHGTWSRGRSDSITQCLIFLKNYYAALPTGSHNMLYNVHYNYHPYSIT